MKMYNEQLNKCTVIKKIHRDMYINAYKMANQELFVSIDGMQQVHEVLFFQIYPYNQRVIICKT